MISYDLAIIGSGPGGYVAALYASRHKLKVCVIEKKDIGGTCLNCGCIPTKSLINSAAKISDIKNSKIYGMDVSGFSVDFKRIVSRKNDAVSRLRGGIETLFRASKIDLIAGEAKITAPGAINISGSQEISAANILIATGSVSMPIPGIDINEKDILSSDGILDLSCIPKSLVIIGGGVIGCEFAGLFNSLGSNVTIVEFTDRLIPTQSREASKKLETIFKKRGIDVLASQKAESVSRDNGLVLKTSGGRTILAEKILVSIGRKPYIECFADPRALGIEKDGSRLKVDDYLETTVKGIYAIGDCVSGPMLAHKASYDGMLACDNMLGKKRPKDYSNIPNCIWTDPEIASVGLTEEGARASNINIKVAKFPYLASGKAYLIGKTEGFVKIIGGLDGKIIGVEIFGEQACELIAEAVLAKSLGVTIEEWSRVVHAHPTLSEILQEAAHVFSGTAIHSI